MYIAMYNDVSKIKSVEDTDLSKVNNSTRLSFRYKFLTGKEYKKPNPELDADDVLFEVEGEVVVD
jgi:hypothetical protein